ncbi:MAG: prepilin peptidase [Anaerovoracaceae bacterium]|jgi:leader peptidase (prepilin peptidase)/N-methyltransferase
MYDMAISIVIFVYGLLIGSFLNVCIYRIPLGKSVTRGRSYCTSCNALIPLYCNIPLFSYIFLKGRCKDCGEKFSVIYPIVELLNALLYLEIWLLYGPSPQSLFIALLFSVLIIITFIDLKHQVIPNGLVLIILILAVLYSLYMILMQDEPWYSYVIGFFAASLPLFILALIYPGGMGGGDIKLMAAAGLYMGWKLILLSLFMGAIYGGIVSIFIIATKKGSMKTAIPFGPLLSLGIITSLLFGEQILTWYFALWV